jgi:8-oxo-dGTP diphosphatase
MLSIWACVVDQAASWHFKEHKMKHWSLEDVAAAKEMRERSKSWVLPFLFVDVVILTVIDDELKVLLTQRGEAPERGKWSLPGVMVRPDTDASMQGAALRAVQGKTNTKAPYLEQLCDFSGPDRDPRGWSSSYAYVCLMPAADIHAKAGGGAQAVKLFDVETAQSLSLAFDHNEMLDAGLLRVRNKVNYSSLPAYLLGPKFTLTELMNTYEVILSQKLDKSAFRKKVQEAGFVCPVEGEFKTGPNRPAQFYEIAQGEELVMFRRNLTP